MEQDSYSVPEVIEALRSVGIVEEVIEYVVPIAGYESRVDGVPFVRDALDKVSPSWGIFQANIDSMAPGIYKAMKELGVIIPEVSDAQDKVLISNVAQPGQESLLNFTDNQKAFVADWFAKRANLNDNALVFKYILEQKKKDLKTNDDKEAMDVMYVLTTKKFMDLENEDAQALKKDLENKVVEYQNTPDDRGIPVPEDGFKPGPVPSTTVPETSDIDTTKRSMGTPPREVDTESRSEGITNQFGVPPMFMPEDKLSAELFVKMMASYVNKMREPLGLSPFEYKERNKKYIKTFETRKKVQELRQEGLE
jgi:hypothetical protein